MSDTSQGTGWWLASDGKWYAPEQAPTIDGLIVRPAPFGTSIPAGPGWRPAGDGSWYPPQGSSPVVPASDHKPFHKRVWFWLLIVVAVGFAGCATTIGFAGVAIDHLAHERHTITYAVSGTGQSAAVEYTTLQEGHGQSGDVRIASAQLPWRVTIVASGLITLYHVSATVGPAGGSVTCSITDNGALVAQHIATGALQSTSCTWGG